MVRFRFFAAALALSLASLSSVHADPVPGRAKPAAVQHLISNSRSDWKLDVHLNHADGIYRIGEQMTIEVHSPVQCYVHIVNVNPQGELNVLWPMDGQTSNKVVPGQTVIFPDHGNHPNYVFEATAPVGKELIVCFATRTPLNLKSPEDARMFGEFIEEVKGISPNPLVRLRSFVTKIQPEENGWTATAFELETTDTPSRVETPANEAVSAQKPELQPSDACGRTRLFIPTTGNVSVCFPGEYRTEPTTTQTVASIPICTTLTMHSSENGLLMFSESVIETRLEHFDAGAALNGVVTQWKEQLSATDAQITSIRAGRLEGREFRGTGTDGISKWLRLYVDSETRASYVVGCCGSADFIEGTDAVTFINSFSVIR